MDETGVHTVPTSSTSADALHAHSIVTNVWTSPILALKDDHAFLLYTLLSLALVLGGHRTWTQYHRYSERAARRAKIHRLVESAKKEKALLSAKNDKEKYGLGGEANGARDGKDGSGREDAGREAAEMPPPENLSLSAGEPSSSRSRASSMSKAYLHPNAAVGAVVTPVAAQKRGKERKKRGRGRLKAGTTKERCARVSVRGWPLHFISEAQVGAF